MGAMHKRMDTRMLVEGVDWSLIRAFVEVVRTGSLSAAARNLGQTQPTLGRQMRRLEELSGEPLFLRTGRELVPTDRARTLYESAGALESEMTALARAFAAGVNGPGVVRIAASELFASRALPDLIRPILAEDPLLELEILAADRLEDLVRRDADIALRFVRPVQPELIAVKVADLPLGLYVARSLLEGRPAPRSLDDLSGWPWVSSRDGHEIIETAAELGHHVERRQLRVRSDSTLMWLSAVEAGLGVGAAPTWLGDNHCGLQRILPDFSPKALPLWLVANEDLHRSPRIRFVFDRLRDNLKRALAACPSATLAGSGLRAVA